MVNLCVVASWIIKIKDNYWACPWNNLDMAGWLIKGEEPVAWQDKKKFTTFPVIMVYMLSTSKTVDSKCVVAS